MWSPTKLNFLFYDLLWFFKDSAKINKKEKDKTALITAYNRAIRWTVLKAEGVFCPVLKFMRKNGLSRKLRKVTWTFYFFSICRFRPPCGFRSVFISQHWSISERGMRHSLLKPYLQLKRHLFSMILAVRLRGDFGRLWLYIYKRVPNQNAALFWICVNFVTLT